jgi:Na+/glutamate symporter
MAQPMDEANGAAQTSAGNPPSWQSTIIALALIALVGAIFIVVFAKEGADAALKVWAAIGTVVGVLAGAIPTYFFGQKATTAAKEESQRAHTTADEERQKRDEAEAKARVVLGIADQSAVEKAAELRPDLFK